jgi:hypothetical protein
MKSKTNQANAQAAKAAKPKEARVITKEKHVPAKVVVGNIPNIDFKPPEKHLKGAMTVVISDGHTTRSWIMHHPIGKTRLKNDDWVLSQSEAVPELLSRKTDDDAPRIAQLKAIERLELATEHEILWKNDVGDFLYKGTSFPRDQVVGDARIRATRKTAEDLVKWQKSSPREGSVAPVPRTYIECIKDATCRKLERQFVEFSKDPEIVEAIENKYPDTFQTRSGPRMDRDQVSACLKDRYPTSSQLFDGFVYQINQMKALSFADAKSIALSGQPAEIALKPDHGQEDHEDLEDMNESSEEEPSGDEAPDEEEVVTTPPSALAPPGILKNTSGGRGRPTEE